MRRRLEPDERRSLASVAVRIEAFLDLVRSALSRMSAKRPASVSAHLRHGPRASDPPTGRTDRHRGRSPVGAVCEARHEQINGTPAQSLVAAKRLQPHRDISCYRRGHESRVAAEQRRLSRRLGRGAPPDDLERTVRAEIAEAEARIIRSDGCCAARVCGCRSIRGSSTPTGSVSGSSAHADRIRPASRAASGPRVARGPPDSRCWARVPVGEAHRVWLKRQLDRFWAWLKARRARRAAQRAMA